jgi:hypothetical protein
MSADPWRGANPRTQTSSTAQQAPVHQSVVLDGTVFGRDSNTALFQAPTTPLHMSVVEHEPVFEHTMGDFDLGNEVMTLNINGFACFNGLGARGEVDTLMKNIRFVGFSRHTVMADAAPNGVQDFTVQTGGTLTVKNTGEHTIRAGDWLMVIPPVNEKGNPINFNSVTDEYDEKMGRVPTDRYVGQLVPFRFGQDKLTWHLISQEFKKAKIEGNSPVCKAATALQDFVNKVSEVEPNDEQKDRILEDLFLLFEAWTNAHYSARSHVHALALSDAAAKQDVDIFMMNFAI